MIPNMSAAVQDPGLRGGGGQTAPGGGAGGGRPVGPREVLDKGAPFVHGEQELAEVTGIALKNLARTRTRQLRQGHDWQLNGVRVCYSRHGLAAVLEKITGAGVRDGIIAGVRLSELEQKTRLEGAGSAAAETPPAAAVVIVQARVTRFFPNPHLLEATAIEGGRVVHVRVRETKNFRRGMVIPVQAGMGGVYELARRAPRFPGRW